MKYLLPILLIALVVAGCSSPAANTARAIGNAVKRCCTPLVLSKETGPAHPRAEESGGGPGASFFEPTLQIVHTW